MTAHTDPSPSRDCVAVSIAAGDDPSVDVNAHFGRAPRFLLFPQGPRGSMEILENPHAEAAQGAGPATASLLARRGVRVVLAGRFGPRAQQTLRDLGIREVVVRPGVAVADALDQLEAEGLG